MTKHRSSLPMDSARGWLRRFESELKKLSPSLALTIKWDTARYMFESAKFTPQTAAAAYKDLELKKARDHGKPIGTT